ncbi:fatty acid desaturase [Gluconacetobacter diazotrophicus PA1 5]|uniref:Fatty acid desaturase n=2 Tax=Gluconacetobacter diazotrophicus TaxID=33996 RepID=A0A7W4I615_GLUDI|nr:fatty acid desaturase [Gluconacetobacter diazotrophicus]ACI52144.1 fatty acid desaturase [Gluconacetobacter diazotrophicus PA1 5]MBB2156907.1 fatty acid desaturase [Gluconacetobacter diazotrophicus]TWB02529.1 fatty acid desaturase [Gluconacetobacter diazotrophicus]
MIRDVSARPAIEWPTCLAILLCYGTWLAAGTVVYRFSPVAGLALLAVAIAFHSSLQHEATHRHPTPSAGLNEILVGLPIGLLYPFRRYRETHLAHHRDGTLTDPDDDPESYYHDPARLARLPWPARWLLGLNNLFLGRLVLGPVVGFGRFVAADARRIGRGDGAVRAAWLIHALSLLPVAWIVERVFGMPFWLYLAGPAYGGAALIGIRTYCEHQWHDVPERRTVIVERSWLAPVFLYNNLHIVHHARPDLPWYRLPAAYRADRQHWHGLNGGYVYRGYGAITWRYLLRRKEPLAHPPRRAAGP